MLSPALARYLAAMARRGRTTRPARPWMARLQKEDFHQIPGFMADRRDSIVPSLLILMLSFTRR